MATPNTITSLSYGLKEYYDGKRVVSTTVDKQTTLDMLPKDAAMAGNPHKVAVITSSGGGISPDFEAAQGSSSGIQGQAFMIEPAEMYAVVTYDHLLLKTAKGGALFDYAVRESNEKLAQLGNRLSIYLFGNGGNAMGQIDANYTSGNTFTLTNPEHAIRFYPGQQLVASNDDGTGGSDALLDSGDHVTVTSVNLDAGTVTVDDASLISGIAANDYLFERGGFAGNVNQRKVFKGFGAWITAAAATDTLWTVARTNYPELSGFRAPSGALTGTKANRIKMAARYGNTHYGARPEMLVVSPVDWEDISIGMEAQGLRLIEVKNSTGITGYEAIRVRTNYGAVDVLSDRHKTSGDGLFITKDAVSVDSLGPLTHLMEVDGLTIRAKPNSAEWETRYASYANLSIRAPFKCGRVALA